MKELFRVIDLDDLEKIGNLKTEAHSKVKSTKYFPIYNIDGKTMIFKPLSKTKPLTTPFFAYSEVYWSYVINKYFDKNAPRYYLAISSEIEKEQPKYYRKGVLVESLTQNNETLTNLYDYFVQKQEDTINIKDYINYCMTNYDYTKILQSEFIKNNRKIGEKLAYQILLSILRQDRNFHYENINFIEDDNSFYLAPPIDFEFSIPFLYPDKLEEYNDEQKRYIYNLNIEMNNDNKSILYKYLTKEEKLKFSGTITRNICLIIKLYPNVVGEFINNLDKFIEDVNGFNFSDKDNYIESLNSDYWKIGHALYKENDKDKAEKLKEKILLEDVDKDKVFERIKQDILDFSKLYSLTLKTYLLSYYNGIEDLELMTICDLLDKLNISKEDYLNNKEEIVKLELRKISKNIYLK